MEIDIFYLAFFTININLNSIKSHLIIFDLFSILKYLKKENPDILLSTGIINISSIIGKKISGKNTINIIRINAYFSISSNRNLKTTLGKVFYKYSDKLIALTHDMKQDLISSLHISENDIKTIYNPINYQSINEKATEKIEHRYFKDSKNEVILGVGRLSEEKDFPTLIKSISILNKERANIKLIILGNGYKRRELEQLIQKLNLENQVSLPGFVENPYKFMRKADVFVLSSKWEGCPNVLLEALAVGTPIVSTNCPSGPNEILIDEKYGKLVPVGDVNAMASAIGDSLDNPIDSDLLQNRAKDFNIDKIVNEYLEFFRKVI